MTLNDNSIEHVLKTLDFIPGLVAVGGCVRDALLKVEPNDIDVASPIKPEKVIRLVEQQDGIDYYETGVEHGTVTIVIEDTLHPMDSIAVEHTTFRKDVSTDGRRATVEFADTFAEDATRRDFTVNAIAVDVDGNVIDPYNGVKDLRESKLNTVGRAIDRFQEDYLRILRALRFSVRFSLIATDELNRAIVELCEGVIDNVSEERIFDEYEKGLQSSYGRMYLMRLLTWKDYFLKPVFPFMTDLESMVERIIPRTLDEFLLCVFGNCDNPEEHFDDYPMSRDQKCLIKYYKLLKNNPKDIFDIKDRINYRSLYIYNDEELLRLYNLAQNPTVSNEELLERGIEPRKIGETQKEMFLEKATDLFN